MFREYDYRNYTYNMMGIVPVLSQEWILYYCGNDSHGQYFHLYRNCLYNYGKHFYNCRNCFYNLCQYFLCRKKFHKLWEPFPKFIFVQLIKHFYITIIHFTITYLYFITLFCLKNESLLNRPSIGASIQIIIKNYIKFPK